MSHETIHSGHFMASNVHEIRQEEEEEIDVVSDGVELPDPEVTPDTKNDKPITFYNFGPQATRSIAIDMSLSKLNRCIQIAYEHGQLLTPKWKNFKGMKLPWQDRIRLNNVIWRAWHSQFVRNVMPKYCFFSVPEDDWHKRAEAAGVMEGMYWKRRLETVCAQYKRWRHFSYKKANIKHCGRRVHSNSLRHSNSEEDALLLPLPSLTPLSVFEDDDWSNWFTDTLFSSLSQPYLFPNPKEMAQAGNADYIQPSLIQLQPSLEEIMASLESSGPLCGENDPALPAESSQFDRNTCAAPGEDACLETLRNSASHYTSKDYAAASLLMEYSNSNSVSSSAGPSHRTTSGGPLLTVSTTMNSLVMPYRLSTNVSSDSSAYNRTTSRDACDTGGVLLCEPYVPQGATIDTRSSQQIQYTLAKTWLNAGDGLTASYERTKEYTPNAATLQLLKKQPSVILECAKTTKQPARQYTKKTPGAVKKTRGRKKTKSESETVLSACVATTRAASISVASTAPTVVGIIGAGVDHRLLSPKMRGKMAQRLSIATNEQQPLTLADMDSSVKTYPSVKPEISRVTGANFSEPPAALTQQKSVLRPIPITLTRAESAFATISPVAYTSPVASSPAQRSPGGSNSSSNPSMPEISKAMPTVTFAPNMTTVVQIGSSPQQKLISGTSCVPSSTTAPGPVLILQPFGAMQFPIMAMPYAAASSVAPLQSFSLKQEQPDQSQLSSYSPAGYALPLANDASTTLNKGASQRPIAQQRSQAQRVKIKSPESAILLSDRPCAISDIKKSAKRPADSTLDPSERKRVQHLHAEQSRRCALKGGFELLEDLLPDFQNSNTKPTNAMVLARTAERVRELKSECVNNDAVVGRLKNEIQQINERINAFQNHLTAAGTSTSTKAGAFQQLFQNYTKKRMQQSWKFWLMDKVAASLVDSYVTEVQGTTKEELVSSAMQWANKHCNHAEMRPVVSRLLVQLATDSPVLKDPASFRKYVQAAIDKK